MRKSYAGDRLLWEMPQRSSKEMLCRRDRRDVPHFAEFVRNDVDSFRAEERTASQGRPYTTSRMPQLYSYLSWR